MKASLTGKVALVAGATRAAGRGIAVELGAAGATVYATGRTTRSARSEMNRPETIEETAELVTKAGGRGIAVQVDHLVPDAGARPRGAHRTGTGRPARARERHLGRHDDGVEQVGLGIQPGYRAPHAATRRRHARHHQPLRDPAPDQEARRVGGGGHGRHGRVQREELPRLVLLRPRQGGGESDGVGARARSRAAWRDGGLAHSRMASIRGHARRVSGDRGELARCDGALASLRDLREPSVRGSRHRGAGAGSERVALEWAVPLERATGEGLRLHRSSMEAGPMPGGTWSKCRTPASPPTSRATAKRLLSSRKRRSRG